MLRILQVANLFPFSLLQDVQREDDLRGERRQQVRQPDLLKKTPLDSDSDGGKPDELTGPTTKTDLLGDVTEAAGREVTSPDPLGPPLPNKNKAN